MLLRGSAIAIACVLLSAPAARAADPDPAPDPAALEAEEIAAAMPDDPIEWAVDVASVECPEGATNQAGRCVPDGDVAAAPGSGAGCGATLPPGAAVGLAVIVLLAVARRRRRLLLALALASACTSDAATWDDAVDAGETGDATAHLDVFSADLGDTDGAQFLLAHQALAAGTHQPVAQFALSRAADAVPILRSASACGDVLSTAGSEGAELLGWARADAGDGTAELVELAAPDGCTHVYETAQESIDALVADGYTVTGSLGYVWPPALGDPVVPATPPPAGPAAAPCTVTKTSAWFLLYASPGPDESEDFLQGCPGEVIVGEKTAAGPAGRMKNPANHALGGRTAYVLDRNGDKLREMLGRPNGVAQTAADLKAALAHGYDYIVVDEITAAADWADGGSLNTKFRKLLLQLPPRTVIGYVSIDLTQYAGGDAKMRNRRLLLRALKQRGRGIAMEIYLHTPQVIAGAAPSTFRIAADRLALAVKGLQNGGGINLRATSVIGTSMHSAYPQYRYLDQPKHDLASIDKQVNAIRHGSKRLRQQHGLGYYFVNKSDMAPPSAYTYQKLIDRMRYETRRFP